jgi:general secretion pathway protein G
MEGGGIVKSGFTLLEILVVVLIITILATVVGVQVARRPGQARIAAAQAGIGTLETALDLYRMDNGRYPTAAQGLGALLEEPRVPPLPKNYSEEGYLRKPSQLQDPWGNDYVYLIPGRRNQRYEVLTYGADAEPGGEGEAADISSAEL